MAMKCLIGMLNGVETEKMMNNLEWANSVKNRDNWTCQECGVTAEEIGKRKIHAHHIKSISKNGENTLENGITVCHNCHWNIFHPNNKGITKKDANIKSPKTALSTDTLFKIDELEKFGYGFTRGSIVAMAIDHFFELVLEY